MTPGWFGMDGPNSIQAQGLSPNLYLIANLFLTNSESLELRHPNLGELPTKTHLKIIEAPKESSSYYCPEMPPNFLQTSLQPLQDTNSYFVIHSRGIMSCQKSPPNEL